MNVDYQIFTSELKKANEVYTQAWRELLQHHGFIVKSHGDSPWWVSMSILLGDKTATLHFRPWRHQGCDIEGWGRIRSETGLIKYKNFLLRQP